MKLNKSNTFYGMLTLCLIILSLISVTNAQISGGTFVIDRSAKASGGGVATGGAFRLDGVIAQPAASKIMNNPPFMLRGGFWNPVFAPTAAHVSVGGRVILGKNRFIKNAIVSIAGGNLIVPRYARTNEFGYFRFNDIEVGQLYIVTVRHKTYGFSQNTQTVMLLDDLLDLVFDADWEN